MFVSTKVFIAGEQHPEFMPEEWHKLEVRATFERGAVQATLTDGAGISSPSIVLVGEGARKVFSHIDGGIDLSTGGILEALPIDFVFSDGAEELKIEYYIDFTKPHLVFRDDYGLRFECQIVKRHSLEWLYESAESFSFSYLYDIGKITDDLINYVEYLTEKRIDGLKIFMVILTLAFVIESVKQMVYEINEVLAKIGGVFTVIEALLVIFQVILKHILTILAIIVLIKNLFEYVLTGILKHNGMYSINLFSSACSHLGLEFKSSILEGDYKQMFHLPAKTDKGFKSSDSENTGYPSKGGPLYNFGGLIRIFQDMFNAQMRIDDGVLRIERKDFWRSLTDYTLPSTKLPPYFYNTADLKSNYLIRYVTDPSDLNTLENIDNLNYQSTVEPKIKSSQDLNLLKGLTEITIGLAHGYRKDDLNVLEKIWNTISKPIIAVANAILKVTNKVRQGLSKIQKFFKKLKKALKFIGVKVSASSGNDPGNQQPLKIETIENKRKGVLKLSDHTFSVDKVFLMKDGKVTEDSYEKMSAEYLYKNFHVINGFDPKYNNQGKVYQNVNTNFCLKDFVTLLRFNGFKTVDGKEGDMLDIRWRFNSNSASLDFILYETYTNNFRNVNAPEKITESPEDTKKLRYHSDEYTDEHD